MITRNNKGISRFVGNDGKQLFLFDNFLPAISASI